MFCPNCGKPVNAGNFCPFCGHKLPENKQKSAEAQPQAEKFKIEAAAEESGSYAPEINSAVPENEASVPEISSSASEIISSAPAYGKAARAKQGFPAAAAVSAAAAAAAAVCLAVFGRNQLAGLPILPLLVLCAIFALFFAADLLGHKFLNIKRSIKQWCLFAVVLTGLSCSCTAAAFSLIGDGGQKINLDFAYRYLLDGYGDAARDKAALCTDEEGDIIAFLADAADGEYLSAYFKAGRISEEAYGKNEVSELINELRGICAGVIGVSDTQTDGTENSGSDITETERREQVKALVAEICDRLGAGSVIDEKTDDLYRLDKALTLDDISGLDSGTVEELLELYPDDEDVLLTAVKYYARRSNYTNALELAKQLVELNPDESNIVVYTDIIAQQIKSGQAVIDTEKDSEAARLLEKAEQKEKEASELDVRLPSEQEKHDQLINEAEDLRDQASLLGIRRAVNYIIAKKPLSGDKSGMLDLQIAKLYLAAGERDKSKKYIWKVVNGSGVLSEDSPIIEPLEEVTAAYNASEAGESDPALTAAVRKLVKAQSRDIVNSSSDDTVNGAMSGFVASTLKYDRLSVLIGKIDTENYPEIRAFVNISGEKDSVFGMAEGFEESDFELFDTQYQIKDFSLVKDEDAEKISIALVMDHSGSMQGSPLENAKQAAEDVAENMDTENQRIALIPYESSSAVTVPLTNSPSALVSGIRGLSAGGGTNISDAINTALGELSGESGTRAVILLTDGQDNNSPEEMQKVLDKAEQEGIAVFTVGLGNVNTSYLRSIAELTGGKFIAAESSAELSDIYLLLQRYIVNNYCFEYIVTENPDTDPRSLMVGIPEYAEDDTKAYRISGEEVDESEEDTGIYPVSDGELALYSLSPSGVSVSEVSEGLEITVRGSGFTDGMTLSIGNIALTDIKVKDAGELTGKLRGSLAPGSCTVQARLPDGRADTLYKGFRVFRAGTVSSVQIGNMYIMADAIGVTGEEGGKTQLTATGNVSINGFLYSTSELTVTPNSGLSDDDLSNAGQKALYLGSGGSVEGDGKLYASYEQAVKTAEKGNALQQMVGHTFAENVFNGKDLVIRNGKFSMDVGESATDFGSGGFTQALEEEIQDFSFKFPGFTEISAAKVTLYADRLQMDAEALDFGDIEDNLVSALTGGVAASKKDREALVKTLGGEWDRFFPLTGSLSAAIGADDISFGGEVELTLPDDKKFFLFPVKKLGLKINSLDKDYEYWSFDVSILMPGIKVQKGSAQSENCIDVAAGSYFWYPDSLEIAASLDPGIPIFKVFNLTKVGGGLSGASGLFITDEAVDKKDVILKVLAEADINVFKILGWKQTGAASSITRWGELGKIIDAEVRLNFSDIALDISADLELLQQKVASAQLGISTEKFLVSANIGTELSCAGIDIGGELEAKVSVRWAGQNQDGVSALIGLGGKGHLRCSWANINWDNQQIGVEFSADIGASDGTTIAVKVYCNDDWARAWYNSEGLMLWDKFHYEDTF